MGKKVGCYKDKSEGKCNILFEFHIDLAKFCPIHMKEVDAVTRRGYVDSGQ